MCERARVVALQVTINYAPSAPYAHTRARIVVPKCSALLACLAFPCSNSSHQSPLKDTYYLFY